MEPTNTLDQAWDIFEIGPGTYQIQRVDELTPCEEPLLANEFSDCFFSDEEAVGYVFLKALAGDGRCKEALKTCYGVDVALG